MEPALFAQAVEPARVRIFILPARIEVNQSKTTNFQRAATELDLVHYQMRFILDTPIIIIVYT